MATRWQHFCTDHTNFTAALGGLCHQQHQDGSCSESRCKSKTLGYINSQQKSLRRLVPPHIYSSNAPPTQCFLGPFSTAALPSQGWDKPLLPKRWSFYVLLSTLDPVPGFPNSRKLSKCVQSLQRRTSPSSLRCSMLAKIFFFRHTLRQACKIGKLDYLWKHGNMPGVSVWESGISSGYFASAPFWFAKVEKKKKEVVFHKRRNTMSKISPRENVYSS